MNMFDEARALWGTIHMCGSTQEEIARRLGVSQSYVANKLRLLKYSIELQDEIVERGLSERHARAILRLPSEELQRTVVRRVSEDGLNVQATEELVEAFMDSEQAPPLSCALARIEKLLGTYTDSIRTLGIRIRKTVEQSDDAVNITLSLSK